MLVSLTFQLSLRFRPSEAARGTNRKAILQTALPLSRYSRSGQPVCQSSDPLFAGLVVAFRGLLLAQSRFSMSITTSQKQAQSKTTSDLLQAASSFPSKASVDTLLLPRLNCPCTAGAFS